MRKRHWILAFALASAGGMTALRAEESVSRLYEDDAWYDVSEWFDGNDYNPTDEAIGRWDNESYSYHEDVGTDQDTDDLMFEPEAVYGDANAGDSGYVTYRDDNDDGTYEARERYYDTDGDRLFDTYAVYSDSDADGEYETANVVALAGKSDKQSRPVDVERELKSESSKRQTVQGTVKNTKFVKTSDGSLDLLLHVQTQNNGDVWVDVGPRDNSIQVFKGDPLTVMGPTTKRGDKQIVIAERIMHQGDTITIRREGRRFAGTVKSLKTVKVDGQPHVRAIVESPQGKMMTMDLGHEKRNEDVEEGDEVAIRGIVIRVGDRPLILKRI